MEERTRFIVVRHGETEWNLQRRMMGQLDSPLTAMGVRQAQQLASRLKGSAFDAVYSSDLGRALETAGILTAGKPAIADARLRERRMGIFEGLTTEESAVRHPEEWSAFQRKDDCLRVAGGESANDVVDRARLALDEWTRSHAGGRVLVVAHGGWLTAVFQMVFGVAYAAAQRAKRPNAGLNVLTRSGSAWTMETWGDVAHLAGIRTLDDPINQP